MDRLRLKRFTESLHGISRFTQLEIEALTHMHLKLCEKYGQSMDRTLFLDFLQNCFELNNEFLMIRVFQVFDVDNNGVISTSEWIYGLGRILRGNITDLAEFVFEIYAMNYSSHISQGDVTMLLKLMIFKSKGPDTNITVEMDAQEMLSLLRDNIFDLIDEDSDGDISRQDFVSSIKKDPCLLECLGICLPDPEIREAFMSIFQVNIEDMETYKNNSVTYINDSEFEHCSTDHMSLVSLSMNGVKRELFQKVDFTRTRLKSKTRKKTQTK